jgi:hypothetical protein
MILAVIEPGLIKIGVHSSTTLLSGVVMLIVHNEAMAYPDFNREVLVAVSSGLPHVENISIINVPVIKQRNFFVSDAFYEC